MADKGWLASYDAVCERHFAVGPVDRDWLVCVYHGGGQCSSSFSAWAGIVALALIVVPVVIRTTESMLTLVPAALREAAYALGTPKWKVIILAITLRAARAGVITGVLLAVARIAGETAPLLFTALNNQFWNGDLTQAHGQLAGDDLQVCHEPLRKLATTGLGGACS